MRRQTEEWHPAGIQVAGEKKIKIESRRRQQKHGVLLRCVYLYLCMVGTILTFRLDLGMKFRVLPVAGVLLLFVLLAILKSIWRPWGRWVYRGAYLLIFLTGGLGWKHLAARMAGGGKQYPASVVGILWGDTGRKNTVAFRGTGRTVADRYFCIVFLEYGNSGGTKRAGRAFGSFGDSDRAFGTDVWLPFPAAGNLSDRRISAGIARDGTKPWSKQSADPLSFRAVGRRAGSLPVTSGRTSRFDAGKTDKWLE